MKYPLSRRLMPIVAALFYVSMFCTSAGAAVDPVVTWSGLSLAPSSTYELDALASINSTGLKVWSVSGSCTLKLGIVTTKASGFCAVKLFAKSKGKFASKTSLKRYVIQTENVAPLLPASFSVKTSLNGLGSDQVNDVFVSDSTIYAATDGGLSISVDGGTTFTNRTSVNGLGDGKRTDVRGVYAAGSTVYAATGGGLSISVDGGTTFTNRTTAHGLGSNFVNKVYAVGSTVYAATYEGLSISVDGGSTFTNKSSANGLDGVGGWNVAEDVFVMGSTIYVATRSGLGISVDGGATFTNRTVKNGLSFCCISVFVSRTTIYVGGIGGLFISSDNGKSFKQPYKKYSWHYVINDLFVVGNAIYAASSSVADSCKKCGGVSISTDGGATFKTYNFNTSNGMGNTETSSVYVFGPKVYATQRRDMSDNSPGGLGISD